MAFSIEQILGYRTLLGLVEAVKTGVPNPFPDAFFTKTKKVQGDEGSYTRHRGSRQNAKVVPYGAPSLNVAPRNIEEVPVKLLHSLESLSLKPVLLRKLRSYDSYELNMGKEEVARQVKQKLVRHQNSRVSQIASILRYGEIYIDSDNNILPSSSGAQDTLAFQVSANHKDQLNGIIATSWATNTTNIPRHILNLQDQSAKDTGMVLKKAYYGNNIPGYFANNDYVHDFLSRTGNAGPNIEYLMSGLIPKGLFGLDWIPVGRAFFNDANGTDQSWFGADNVVFTPGEDDDWYEMLEGSYPVPTRIDVETDAAAALESFKDVHGMFAYATVAFDPPGIKMFTGDTNLWALKNADAIYIADVTP